MLNKIEDIKSLWIPEELDVNEDDSGNSDYDKLINRFERNVKWRMIDLVGVDAYTDASHEMPDDQMRAEKLREAEKEFFEIQCLEFIWRQKASGAERDVQMPSGFRITLQAFGSDDYISMIKMHVKNAERFLGDYL